MTLALASEHLRVESELPPFSRAMATTQSDQIDGLYAPAICNRLPANRNLRRN